MPVKYQLRIASRRAVIYTLLIALRFIRACRKKFKPLILHLQAITREFIASYGNEFGSMPKQGEAGRTTPRQPVDGAR
jgi:hypothetical protein